jgi:hypothetical protein
MIVQDDQGQVTTLKRNWLYLDMCTTEDQMIERGHLENIHKRKNPWTLCTNMGSSCTNKRGYIGSTLFWLNKNQKSECRIPQDPEKNFHVTYGSRKNGETFVCETPKQKLIFS